MGVFTPLVVGHNEHEIATVPTKRNTTEELIRRAKQLIEDFDSLAEEHLKIKARREERNRLALDRERYRPNDGDSDVEDR